MDIGRLCLNVFGKFVVLITLASTTTSEGFNPTLRTLCVNGIMNVTIRTELPFQGAIYADGRRNECYVTGFGAKETTISIPFAAVERCGIQYDSEEEQYYVLLVIRQHPRIILQQDKVYNVSCSKFGFREDKDESQIIQMGLFNADGRKIHQAIFGQNYSLKVWTSKQDDDFVITSCQGFSSYNYTLELTTPNGCSRDTELLSNFKYEKEGRVAVAQLFSMFKFPHQQMVHLQCAAIFCQDSCFRPDCERRRDQPLDDDALKQSERLFQEKYTSTTVRVQDVGNLTEIRYEISCAFHYSLLLALCVLFATLFALSLCVNVAFCALTGYCCCSSMETKSENVEYVVADAKSIDAMNSTIARECSTALYSQITSLKSQVLVGGSSYSPQSSSTSSDPTKTILLVPKNQPKSLPTSTIEKISPSDEPLSKAAL